MNYLLLVVLPNLDCFFSIMGILGTLGCFIAGPMWFIAKEDIRDEQERNTLGKYILRVFITSLCSLFISCFIPNKKEVIQLKALSIITELRGVNQIPQKLIDRLNDLLDDNTK